MGGVLDKVHRLSLKGTKLAGPLDPLSRYARKQQKQADIANSQTQPAPTPPAPELFDPDAIAARDKARRLARRAYGRSGTIKTGGQGAELPELSGKKLLGS